MKKGNYISVTNIVSGVRDQMASLRKKMLSLKKQKRFTFAEIDNLPPLQNNKILVDITPSSVAKAVAVVLLMLMLFQFLTQIHGIIIIFFISFLFAAALDPVVDSLQHFKIPRAVGVLIVYIIVFVFLGIFVTNVVTLVAEQVLAITQSVGQFVFNLTQGDVAEIPYFEEFKPYLDQFYKTIDIQSATFQLQTTLKFIADQLLSISFGLANVGLTLILTFFMTVEEKAIQEFFLSLFSSKHAYYISTRMEAVKDQIGHWIRGQVFVSFIAAVLTYIGLALMGINYALTLSIIAGIFMVIPVIGPIFAWVITFPIVFNQSPILSLWMSIYYFIIQQLEGNIIVPYIMNKAVGLSPVIIIFAMMVGWQYLGILGLILAIPIATTVAIFIHDYSVRPK